jgi:peptidoglycan hydrolase CwlO-like protein
MIKYLIIIVLVIWGWGQYGADITTEVKTWKLEQRKETLTNDIIKLKTELATKIAEGTEKFYEIKEKLEKAQKAFQETKEALEKLNQATKDLKESVGLDKNTTESLFFGDSLTKFLVFLI